MNESFLFGILSTAVGGLATLLNIGLAVVGIIYVRRVNPMAGLCMAGAGALGAFASIIRRLVGLVGSFVGGTGIFTVSQIFTTLLNILASALIPLAIFLLASSIKQSARPSV